MIRIAWKMRSEEAEPQGWCWVGRASRTSIFNKEILNILLNAYFFSVI